MEYDDEQIFEFQISDDEYVLASSLPVMTAVSYGDVEYDSSASDAEGDDSPYLYGMQPQLLYECCVCRNTDVEHQCWALEPRQSLFPSLLLLLDVGNEAIQINYRKWLYTRL